MINLKENKTQLCVQNIVYLLLNILHNQRVYQSVYMCEDDIKLS